MKRLLIRMSVLAVVVVLGWIAIAQAQRGTADSSPTSDATPSLPVDEGAPAPILAPVARGYSTPSGSADSGVNPLRAKRLSFNDLASAPAAGATGATNSAVAGAAVQPRPQTATVSFGQTSDPFARPADATNPVRATNATILPTAATSSAAKSAAIAEVSAGENLPSLTSAASTPSAQPAGSDSTSPTVPANSNSSGNAASQGGAALSKEPALGTASEATAQSASRGVSPPARAGEPAPFKLDPTASNGSLPLRGPSADRAAPGATPSQGASAVPDASASFGTGKPGARQLEGPQSPSLTVQKLGPAETQVGKAATFETRIRNSGQTAAHGVEVRDEVPKGTRLLSTSPRATQGVRGELVWQLGAIKSGDEITVQMQVMPLEEGEIGSVATVHFSAEASVRTIATKPELLIKATGPGKVTIGEEVGLTILVSNPGSGAADNVVLQAKIPASLRHPAGADLEYEVGVLKPKESRQLELKLIAVEAGTINLPLIARAEANLTADGRFDMEVIAPRLEVALEGPKRRFLEREATYTLSVSNPGTAPARQVQLVCQLPPGLQFVNANNAGQYEAATRTVHWLLEELPIRETGKVELTTMPTEPGEQKLVLRGVTEKGVSAEREQPVVIEGVTAIRFDLTSLANPIVRGAETTYEVHVMNQGSKAATNVRVSLLLPPEMRALAAEGPTRHQIESNRVVFEGLSQLAAKADTTYRVRVQGLQPGDLRIRAQLLTDEIQTPVTKEESTRVYSDE